MPARAGDGRRSTAAHTPSTVLYDYHGQGPVSILAANELTTLTKKLPSCQQQQQAATLPSGPLGSGQLPLAFLR